MPNIDMDLDLSINPILPKRKDFRIGCIGAGFIMKDCHLVAYKDAGFNPVAITSRKQSTAEAAAAMHGIPKVHKSWKDLIKDPEIEVLDIAIPPDCQLEVIREAVKEKNHIKGILAQKPLAMNIQEAAEIVRLCDEAGIKLGVNSNMRYDQSMRALKTILERNYLGEPVLASIEMRAIPHWQDFLKKYDRIEMLNMGIHHLDVMRYLFGDPEKITAVTRKDPRTTFNHIDGITHVTYKYENDFMATTFDDVWGGPDDDQVEQDYFIKWRVEGLDGIAQGTINWPKYPVRVPSTLDFTSRKFPRCWIKPRWDGVWFPDAFAGTMSQLLRAIETDTEPEISGKDNLKTFAVIDAAYLSIKEERTVTLEEVYKTIQ